jgi:DNA repair protein RecO (recombination protein O)
MRQLTDEGYVLRTQPLGEADLIVSFFTLGHGTVRGVAKAARRSRKRFGAALEPLTRVRVAWTEALPGRELSRIDGVEGQRSFATMQSDPALQAACAVVIEVASAFAREEQPDPPVFRLLGAVLDALDARAPVLPVLRYFEYWMARIHGLLPALDACASCGTSIVAPEPAFVDPTGRVVCRACDATSERRGQRLSAEDLAFCAAARVRPPDQVPAPPAVGRPDGPLEALLRGTLETFAETRFRSYRHLRVALGRADAS